MLTHINYNIQRHQSISHLNINILNDILSTHNKSLISQLMRLTYFLILTFLCNTHQWNQILRKPKI